jgi:methylated-DNA-[protein]-cysteine S-methyltransferase
MRRKKRTVPKRVATPFEERVYAVVRRIPRGQVRSYGWVARRLGNRRLARAVGQALHRNPDTCRTPCHRVIAGDGRLGGYAGGPARKRARLRAEGVNIA